MGSRGTITAWVRSLRRARLTCRQLVELVTEYVEGSLSDDDRDRFDAHLARCAGCQAHVEQMRDTIAAVGRIPPDSLSPEAERELAEAFTGWRQVT